jgi:hypothetical protein
MDADKRGQEILSACVRKGLRLILILMYLYHDIALKKSITFGELMGAGIPGRAAGVFPGRRKACQSRCRVIINLNYLKNPDTGRPP